LRSFAPSSSYSRGLAILFPLVLGLKSLLYNEFTFVNNRPGKDVPEQPAFNTNPAPWHEYHHEIGSEHKGIFVPLSYASASPEEKEENLQKEYASRGLSPV
jgi:hypothetical protein